MIRIDIYSFSTVREKRNRYIKPRIKLILFFHSHYEQRQQQQRYRVSPQRTTTTTTDSPFNLVHLPSLLSFHYNKLTTATTAVFRKKKLRPLLPLQDFLTRRTERWGNQFLTMCVCCGGILGYLLEHAL